jgi:flavin-dependent dehydrogenase
LELELHVGKRCLVVGDAGGFLASFSHEGLYPAIRSGQLAVEAVVRALEADVLQDELATFGAAWRAELAAYLQMPNTDLGLLLPMVFGNAEVSRRVARAFLLGQRF